MKVMALIPRENCRWDEEAFEQYSRGELPEAETAALEEHLLVCEFCQERLANEDAVAGTIRRAAAARRQESNAAKPRSRLFPGWLPAVAGIAALLIATFIALRWVRPEKAAPAVAVKLEAMRGTQPGSQAPAGRPLVVQADLTGLPASNSYRLELVEPSGKAIWKGHAPSAYVPALAPGLYFMRVYAESGELMREYGLEVR